MLMHTHEARLDALRKELARQELDGFVIPISDEHMSEYVGGYAIGSDVPESYEDGSSGLALDLPSYRGVRASLEVAGERRDWKYVAWFADDDFTELTDEEVYDLTQDPWELDNLLATNPQRARAALPQLQELLRSLSSCKGRECFR